MIELFKTYLDENIAHPTGGIWEHLANKLINEMPDEGLRLQMISALEKSNAIRNQVHSKWV